MPLVKLNVVWENTISGTYEIDVDVPQDVLDDGDLIDWVNENVKNLPERALSNGDTTDEEFDVTEIEDLGEVE